jgi:BirA family biotin operon repressor/biotin-[acetyl-CoA-carboxylase] ligase
VAAPQPVVVVGLGLNVTEAPDPAATSLSMLNVAVDRTVLAEAVLAHLAARIGSWRAAAGADATLAADYRSRSVTIGSRVRASLPGDRAVEGVASDIDRIGRLRIDTGEPGQGGVLTVSAGDITHLRPVNP